MDHVQDALNSQSNRNKARLKAQAAISDIVSDLSGSDWWNESWLDAVLAKIDLEFNHACERWRDLYRAAKQQQKVQHAIINDASRSPQDRQQARRLRQEAESQLELLTEATNIVQSDFYSYRYFASEGFLPGYSFPRLPLSAYIPARRIKGQNDEFLSRPRFLAISEFGPRSIIYHEGSRYIINKVNLPVSDTGEGFATYPRQTVPGMRIFTPDFEWGWIGPLRALWGLIGSPPQQSIPASKCLDPAARTHLIR